MHSCVTGLRSATTFLSVFLAAGMFITMAAHVAAQSPNAQPAVFDVISVKRNTIGGPPSFSRPTPNRFLATNLPLRSLILSVYRIRPFQLEQAPDWTASERFDIDARTTSNTSPEGFTRMLEALLADRFRLAVRHEKRELPIYALVVSKPDTLGPSLQRAAEPVCPQAAPPSHASTPHESIPCGSFAGGPGRIEGRTVTMSLLASILGGLADRSVEDRTGLTGTFDVRLEFSPQAATTPINAAADGVSLFTAINEQLGLKLDSAKGPVDVVIVEHVERPSSN